MPIMGRTTDRAVPKPKEKLPEEASPKPVEMSSHTIHTDGTYTNAQTTAVEAFPSLKGKAPAMSVLMYRDGSRFLVLEQYDWGVSVVPHPCRRSPSIEDGVVMSWEDLQAKSARKV